jgi:hypothetical protein
MSEYDIQLLNSIINKNLTFKKVLDEFVVNKRRFDSNKREIINHQISRNNLCMFFLVSVPVICLIFVYFKKKLNYHIMIFIFKIKSYFKT